MTPMQQLATPFASVGEVQDRLRQHAYLADRPLATAIHLSLSLGKPLLLEGEAGVGKTEVAKVLAEALDRRLIRLQCYEGIDASQALYEWNYSRQLIAIRAMQAGDAATHVDDLFGPEFLVERPLLAAVRAGSDAVLLVDELDRADDEFEAFLLEILSEFAVTVPELGRVAGEGLPAVVITSNRTRELHDALKRRCLYHWIDHPALEREVEIIGVRAPEVPERLARQVAEAVARIRALDVAKRPGVAEAIDWANALAFLGVDRLDGEAADATLGAVLKDHDDLELARADLGRVVGVEG
jgi:MoxR-like ATPase